MYVVAAVSHDVELIAHVCVVGGAGRAGKVAACHVIGVSGFALGNALGAMAHGADGAIDNGSVWVLRAVLVLWVSGAVAFGFFFSVSALIGKLLLEVGAFFVVHRLSCLIPEKRQRYGPQYREVHWGQRLSMFGFPDL